MSDTLLATKVNTNAVYGMKHDDVVKALRGLAQDNARNRIEVASLTDVTDSTGGTAGTTTVAVTTPSAFTVTATDASPKAGFDTATGKLANCAAEFADFLNPILATLGLEQIVQGNGTVGSAGTLAALDLTLTAVDGSGSTALEAVSAAAQIVIARNNQATILRKINEICTAVGDNTLANNTGGTPDKTTFTLDDRAATSAGVDGTALSTLSDTAVDAALTALGNNYATMAAHINTTLFQAGLADLTDNSGGSSTGDAQPDLGTMTAYTTAGTDCAPKAEFETELAKIRNNFADLTARVNLLAERHNLGALTDSSAGTANTTLEVVSQALTAVTGTTVCIDQPSALTTWNAVKNNVATITAKINEIVPYYGQDEIVDSSGGTVSTADTVVAMPDTDAGNDGTADQTVADTEMDADLVLLVNWFATAAAKLNAVTGTLESAAQSKPLKVVATA